MSKVAEEEESAPVRNVDPLLKDLRERKQSVRRNVVSLAAELKVVRSRLASREQSFALETITRQEIEVKSKKMETEICRLEDRNKQFQASSSSSVSQNYSLKEQEDRLNRVEERLELLQKDVQAREFSQKQLRDEVMRIEHGIMESLMKSESRTDCELRKVLERVSPNNFDKMNKFLNGKDEEISKLRDEIRVVSAHWKLKTKELETQLDKHRRPDQELKKRVQRLEFCLQEARAQTRKLQRKGERQDKALKELMDQLATNQQDGGAAIVEEPPPNFWESSRFKAMGAEVNCTANAKLALIF